jgi:holliday junction DNA helicase RuvB
VNNLRDIATSWLTRCKILDREYERLFGKIIGHQDVKNILNNAILSKKPVHVILVGLPGSGKTMFLLETERYCKESIFVVGSNTTKAGLLNRLFESRPKFVLIDEIEKMNSNDQNSLLHLMETGLISETKINKTRQMKLTSWVFATANSIDKISEPLLSRFLVLKIPLYTFEQFKQIAVFRLKQEKVDGELALIIAQKVWHEFGSNDIRDAIKIGRLSTSIEDACSIVKIMKKMSTK